MKKITFILLIMITGLLFANDFRFYTNYASFYDKESTYVELYFMFPRVAMDWQKSNDKLHGKFLVAVNIYREDTRVFSETIAVEDEISVRDTISSLDFIPEIISLHLVPGKYTMNTTVRDFYSGNVSERSDELDIKAYDTEKLALSDVEIASYVAKTTGQNKFTKLGMYDIIPLANPEFDMNNGIFFAYFEVYNLHSGGKYTCTSSIRDLNEKIILENDAVQTVAPGKFDIVIDYMDIRELGSGTYNYHVNVRDETTGDEMVVTKRIHMMREVSLDDLIYDDYSLSDEKALDSMYLIFKPLMNANEVRKYNSYTAAGKRQFFIEFWKKRDSNMETPINEYYLEIMDRVRYATEHFTYFNRGPRSDRGRVLLKYGYPSEIQRSAIGGGTKDHEIWLYEGMRGDIKFVFCDIKGQGYFELIHSNMEGEAYNANWKDVIQAGAKNY